MSQTIHYAAFRCDVSIWSDVRDRDICRGQIVAHIVIFFHYNREKMQSLSCAIATDHIGS